MSRSKYGSYRSSYLSPFGSDHRITRTQHNIHSDQGNKKKRTRSRREHGGIEARSDPGLPYFLRREETACMWRRASGLRRGFTSQLDSADIIDDMVAEVSFVLRGGGMRFPFASSLLWEKERRRRWAWVRTRSLGQGRTEDRENGLDLHGP